MSTEIQPVPALPHQKSVALRCREFCEQWRHSYLLLAASFWGIWRASALPITMLDNIRIYGGLHPMPVLLLMQMLEIMWVPLLLTTVLYVASFLVPRLNTSGAVAVSALGSTALLGFVLLWALINISLGFP